ncbi:KamA family radical SAM protein [bacterium]|nr:KamA family radical SAM protein [bacterium]MBU1985353.1 KamA family radical SAM protein [bacterium]
MNTKYITHLEQVQQVSAAERTELDPVTKRFAFRCNEYFLSLIGWDDPGDPLRRLVIPSADELEPWGEADPSREADYTVAPGLEHKYGPTALILASRVCAAYCRFCFRKRIFTNENAEVPYDLTKAYAYIREHNEITNVLLTGGDPLLLSTSKLKQIVAELRTIEHVQIIRIGTKVTAFNPHRVLNDPPLVELLGRYSTPEKRIYIVSHFDHPRELTEEAVAATSKLLEAGCRAVNQTPIIRGVNDDPEVLAELFRKLSFIGVPPYYVFQCRPTYGNKAYTVPIEEAYLIFERARTKCSGLAKRARFVMSHATGKIEIVGISSKFTYLKYHSSPQPEYKGRFLVFHRNPEAYWLEDFGKPVDDLFLDDQPAIRGLCDDVPAEDINPERSQITRTASPYAWPL